MVSKIRLQICHHNRLFRECLDSALAGDEAMDVLTTSGPETGMEALGPGDRELLLLDAGLPGAAAFDLIRAVRASGRGLRIVLMVPAAAPELIKSCLMAGADGCVDDDDTLDDLRRAIEVVLSGQSYCSPQVARRLFTGEGEAAPLANGVIDGRACDLTMREDEILRLI